MTPSSPAPQLYLVDVFAERPMAGNQLAVVVGADPAAWTTERMQAFAHEMNFSETTFATPAARDGAYDVRIFTPAEELPFAGHPTLGSAWVLRRHLGTGELARGISLRLGIGVVPVEFDETEVGELVRMRPRTPDLGPTMDAAEVARHLSLSPDAIDPRHGAACRRVNVGIEFVILPLRSLEALRAARAVSLPAGEPGKMLGVLAVAPEAYEPGGDLSVRVFFDALGIREDPATGSAAACLAAWLSTERYFGDRHVRARVQQGYEVGRPSCLYLEADPDGVRVAGKVQLVARGELA